MDAGELALGPKGFKEYAGHFWGFLETRPYMRARAGLAGTLLKLGDEDAAIRHYRDHQHRLDALSRELLPEPKAEAVFARLRADRAGRRVDEVLALVDQP